MMPSDAAEPTTQSARALGRAPSVNDDAETVARERVSASELGPVLSSTPRHDRMPRDSAHSLLGDAAKPPSSTAVAGSSPAQSAAPSPVTLAAASPPPPTSPIASTASSDAETSRAETVAASDIATDAPTAPIAEPTRTSATLSTAPDSLAPPTPDQIAASGPSPACPNCDAPMAWVEAHLRFFCKPCRMYF